MTETTLTARHALTVALYGNDLRIAHRLLVAEGYPDVARVLAEVENVEEDYGFPLGRGYRDGSWTVPNVRQLADKALAQLDRVELLADFDATIRANMQETTEAELAARSISTTEAYTSTVAIAVADAALAAAAAEGAPKSQPMSSLQRANEFMAEAAASLAKATATTDANDAYLACKSATLAAASAMRIVRRNRHEAKRLAVLGAPKPARRGARPAVTTLWD